MPPEQYVQLLSEEIRQTEGCYQKGVLTSIYFGGGTPSLLDPNHIVSIIGTLANYGFIAGPQTEITIEINPATITGKKMETYLSGGVNRFSVGAQTFDDRLLKMVNREHNAEQTRETLRLIQSFKANYSFDLLFALPTQTLPGLQADLEEVLQFLPNHLSPYCLTVPEGHVLSKNRPLEGTQIEMFEEINKVLGQAGYLRYEISNFCLPTFESKHNSLYWDDSPYWGLGLSAHSYSINKNWGLRYWNASSIGAYHEQIENNRGRLFTEASTNLPAQQCEHLEFHQSVTDFCHISLRQESGIELSLFRQKFGAKAVDSIEKQLFTLEDRGWIVRYDNGRWRLTEEGILLSNQVFAALTFLAGEISQ